MFVDSHCHLNFPQLKAELNTILQAMEAADVRGALCISTTLEEFDDVHALTTVHPNFWASVGVHPDNEGVQEPTVDGLVQRAQRPRVVAIGGAGGSTYYRLGDRTVADMEWQRSRFRAHALPQHAPPACRW